MDNLPPKLNLTPKHPEMDWHASGETGVVYEDRTDNWSPYLPISERQNFPETFSCVTFATQNPCEAQIKYLYLQGQIPEEGVTYMKEEGIIDDSGNVNLSDIFIAIISGTTKEGNHGYAVAEAIRKEGNIADKVLPFEGRTWEEVMDTKRITPAMKEKAKEFWKKSCLRFNWEWVYIKGDKADVREVVKKHVKQAPLVFFTPVCPGWNKGNVKTCPLDDPQHATCCYRYKSDSNPYCIEDTYSPFKKTLAEDYPVLYVLKPYVSVAPKEEPVTKPKFNWQYLLDNGFVLKEGMRGEEVKALQNVLIHEGLLNKQLNTGYFGQYTKNAVKAFQQKHYEKILLAVGLVYPTGIVAKSTLKYLVENYS